MIKVENVTHIYGDLNQSTKALDNIELEIGEGESAAFIGPSGCGKSTLLFLLTGLLSPTKGKIRINGDLVKGQRSQTALILQDYGLFPWKTVWDNAALGLEIRGVSKAQQKAKVMPVLEELGLGDFLNKFPAQLSGGQRQRVAIARSLALEPDLLLMDEPFSSLDALTRESLQDVIIRTRKHKKVTLVLVTHNIEEASYLGNKIVVFTPRPGRIKAVLDNPRAGNPDYRLEPEFYQMCTGIRNLLEVKS